MPAEAAVLLDCEQPLVFLILVPRGFAVRPAQRAHAHD